MPDALRHAAIGDSIPRGFLMGLPRPASEEPPCTAPLSGTRRPLGIGTYGAVAEVHDVPVTTPGGVR